jgi:hypothetical protein
MRQELNQNQAETLDVSHPRQQALRVPAMRLYLPADLQALAAQAQAAPSEDKLLQQLLSPECSASRQPVSDPTWPGF